MAWLSCFATASIWQPTATPRRCSTRCGTTWSTRMFGSTSPQPAERRLSLVTPIGIACRFARRGRAADVRDCSGDASSSNGEMRDPFYFDFSSGIACSGSDYGQACAGHRLRAATWRSIKKRQDAHVTGIELIEAGRIAQSRLDRVIVGDIESLTEEFPADSFDAVLCGDVLEHLRDPLTVLRRVRNWLTPEGHLITSIPMFGITALRSLMEGHWTYEPAGLLDQTHLCFFTRREMEKLLFRAGYYLLHKQIVTMGDDADGARGPPVRLASAAPISPARL